MIRDPELARLADAVLIPPFPGHTPPRWILSALEGGLAGRSPVSSGRTR